MASWVNDNKEGKQNITSHSTSHSANQKQWDNLWSLENGSTQPLGQQWKFSRTPIRWLSMAEGQRTEMRSSL